MTPSLQWATEPKWLLPGLFNISCPVILKCCCSHCNIHHQLHHHCHLLLPLNYCLLKRKIHQDLPLSAHIRMHGRLCWCSFLPFLLLCIVNFCHLHALIFLVNCPIEVIWAPVIYLGLFGEGMILKTKHSFVRLIILSWTFLDGEKIQIQLGLLLFVFVENIGVAKWCLLTHTFS